MPSGLAVPSTSYRVWHRKSRISAGESCMNESWRAGDCQSHLEQLLLLWTVPHTVPES